MKLWTSRLNSLTQNTESKVEGASVVVRLVKGNHSLAYSALLTVGPNKAACKVSGEGQGPGQRPLEEVRLQTVSTQQVDVHVHQEDDAHAVQVDVERLSEVQSSP